MNLDSIYMYNLKFIKKAIKKHCSHYINLIILSAKLYIIIYINNRYIDQIKLCYLHFKLENKVKYKYNI